MSMTNIISATHNMYKHGMNRTRQYRIWIGMLARCRNPNVKHYHRYGGRGITVCKRWYKFENFWEDMEDGYNDKMTIDRIDNKKGYSKKNCQWLTNFEQQSNKRNVRIFEYKGKHYTIPQLSRLTGAKRETLRARLNKGMSTVEAVEEYKPTYICWDAHAEMFRATYKKKTIGRYKTKKEALSVIAKILGIDV